MDCVARRTLGAMEVPQAVDASWNVELLRDEADRDILYKVKFRKRVTMATGESEFVALSSLVAMLRSRIVFLCATSKLK